MPFCFLVFFLFTLNAVQASSLYPKTRLAQESLMLEKGFADLTDAAARYSFDVCAFPTLTSQITPSYAFLPVESGLGTWSVGVNGGGNQGYVCYHASSDGVSALARQAVKNNHTGLIVAPSCGAIANETVAAQSEVLTWWLDPKVFPDDCITGP